MSRSHHFHTSATVPVPRARVFPFFADASNLERITPPELRFRIISLPSEMGEGSLIRYSLGLYGVRFEWLTRISAWNPPVEFSDEQLEGPYRRWVHRHRFEEQGQNTIIHDDVQYALPLFPFGEIAAPLVRAQVRRIFAFRARAIAQALR